MKCPFCGRDPYEYADVGIGNVPIAVSCCRAGYDYFRQRRRTAVPDARSRSRPARRRGSVRKGHMI